MMNPQDQTTPPKNLTHKTGDANDAPPSQFNVQNDPPRNQQNKTFLLTDISINMSKFETLNVSWQRFTHA